MGAAEAAVEAATEAVEAAAEAAVVRVRLRANVRGRGRVTCSTRSLQISHMMTARQGGVL